MSLHEIIRPETPTDAAAIRALLCAAFPTNLEAELVDRLRESGRLTVSLVAERQGRIVGHVACSPVTVAGHAVDWAGLAPVAVLPDCQRQGIGRRLVAVAVESCRDAGLAAVVVLGEPGYYGPLGFTRASRFGLSNEYGVDEPFRVRELRSGALADRQGLVQYAPEFAMFAGESSHDTVNGRSVEADFPPSSSSIPRRRMYRPGVS